MKTLRRSLLLVLADSDYDDSLVEELLTDWENGGVPAFARDVRTLPGILGQHAAKGGSPPSAVSTGVAPGMPAVGASEEGRASTVQSAEEIAELLSREMGLTAAEAARQLAKRLGYKEPLPKKKALRDLVRRLVDFAGSDRAARAAVAMVREQQLETDWPLGGPRGAHDD